MTRIAMVTALSLSYKRLPIADAIAMLIEYESRGMSHVRMTVSRMEPVPPKPPKPPKSPRSRERGTPGKIRPNGRDGTVREL